MKPLKRALIASFALVSIPSFGMFLDPVLKNYNDTEFQEFAYQNNYNEHSENDFPVTIDIINKTCEFCSKTVVKKDVSTFYIENKIAHTECLKKELEKRVALQNQWRFCPACDVDYTCKENRLHIRTLPQWAQTIIKEKMKDEQSKSDTKLMTGLPVKFFTTTLLTFGIMYSHKKFHWSIDFFNSFLFGMLDSYYGISSAQLHTSSNVKIKLLGKCLSILANKVIPAYTLYASLNKKFLSEVMLSSVQINQPNKISLLKSVVEKKKFKQPKNVYSPYPEQNILF